ncbi:MAG: GTPase [Candidatus Yanofskybacteria bacterium RIFCSPHIGHO2_02_FULL_39_10]|uniref:GTPase n=1 Tax=Candidatus Yanofskybacteria bacterium RIFCSPHIGHO2_02_FULL_39_10 TaxID=1802674 RepID=A0A1F8F7Q3_9BACT|nr:MAG: GTPase [Candidatus Yanofskybacteria bacterium RIFCSPHIGHO2_02_FULL_39_10]
MQNIIILGAAGRDFHNFNVVYRNDKTVNVVAFTANQIPGISDRKYPASLAGRFYPKGIPIYEEKDLERIIKSYNVGECVLSYSDLSYDYVMHLASRVAVTGAKFSILGAEQTMIKSKKPVIAVLAVRTGCGKSQTSRRIVEILRSRGKRVVSVRHPMPYGDLAKQAVQRFAKIEDLKKHKCTIEEMEEYEPHIAMGSVIYAGVDYGKILEQAEKEADVIIWDGGNNDTSFYKPDVTITVADPLRAGHEVSYYPGEINFRLADMILINKVDSADAEDVATVVSNAKKFNPKAIVLKAESKITVDDPSQIKGKKVLVVEDGPTLTHGEMKIGAGTVAAQRFGASKLVDPRPFISGSIRGTFNKYPNIGTLLPAMGYGNAQMKDLEATINRIDCDSVVIGTPINLARFIKINKPFVRVKYDLSSASSGALIKLLKSKKIIK